MHIKLYVQPGAKKTELVGFHDGLAKLRIAAPPVEGAANKAVTEFIARTLGLPKNAVSITGGEKSRVKTVSFDEAAAKHKDNIGLFLK